MCVFCAIVSGEADAAIVYEDEATLAFLDKRPLFHGHSLLVPREHHETLVDLPTELVGPLFGAARLLAAAIPDAMEAKGSLVLVNNKVSQSVPHLHVHVIPRKLKDGLRGFLWPRRPYRDEAELNSVADAIRAAVARRKNE